MIDKLPGRMIELQGEATTAQAQHLHGPGRFLRINDAVAPGRFSLDRADGLDYLEAIGRMAARHSLRSVRNVFG